MLHNWLSALEEAVTVSLIQRLFVLTYPETDICNAGDCGNGLVCNSANTCQLPVERYSQCNATGTLDLKAIGMTKCVLLHVYMQSCLTQLDKSCSLVCVYEVPLGTLQPIPGYPCSVPHVWPIEGCDFSTVCMCLCLLSFTLMPPRSLSMRPHSSPAVDLSAFVTVPLS